MALWVWLHGRFTVQVNIESLLDDVAERCSPASGAAEARLFGEKISLYLHC